MTAKAAGSDPGPSSREWIGVVRHYLPSVVIFFVALLLWELLVRAANLQRFVLPRPTAIGAAFAERSDTLIPSARETLFEAIGGLAIGTSAGLAVAFLAARFTTMRDALLPWGVAASAVPIIAFAPIMNNWFGVISPLSKMMIVAVLVFFPVMINVTRGLSLVDPGALELMRSYAAGETTVLRQVRIPNALPYFFTAMKIATTLSLIGAIVASTSGVRISFSVGRSCRAPALSASTSRGRPSPWERSPASSST